LSPLLWSAAIATIGVVVLVLLGGARRSSHTRHVVLDEVRRKLRGGTIESLPSRGPQARGQLGELEVTVDLHHDPRRRRESPMWRVMAVGPVRITEPVEVRVGDWGGWIDPWMQMEKVLALPPNGGPAFSIHARQPTTFDHPVIVALRRQGPALTSGALHAQHDFMRAEVRYEKRPEDNRALFAFLDAMAEISSSQSARAGQSARIVRMNVGRDAS
jgi:hypothetical protein